MTWPPKTEEDVVAALEAGDIAESNRLDMKATVGDSPGSRKETAKDLASFAVDGGALLIGVAEDKTARTFSAAPVDLHDVVERIEQIAANRVDPPVVVRPRAIESATTGAGYVWVDIPASPDAPHMVDGRYYGRGERTNRILTDAEVLRLHAQRRDDKEKVHDALRTLKAHDPYDNSIRDGESSSRFGHLYLVAVPRRAAPNLAENLIWDRQDDLLHMVGPTQRMVPEPLYSWGPHLMGLAIVPHAASVSLTNLAVPDLDASGVEEYGLDVRISDSGDVGLTVTRISVRAHDRDTARILDATILGNAWHLLAWVRQVADALTYTGDWDIGLSATWLRGKQAQFFANQRFFRGEGQVYDEDEYTRVISVTRDQLDDERQIISALTKPLLRGLGSWPGWQKQLDLP